jgi:tetratricopeptide (TPR) repeat protein
MATGAVARLLAMLGRLDEAWPMALRARDRSRELGFNLLVEFDLAEIALLADELESAADYLRLVVAYFEERHQPGHVATFAPRLARVLCMLGRHEEAEPLARRGRELASPGDMLSEASWRQAQALIDSHSGRHVEADALAREAVATIEQTDALEFQGSAWCDLADVLEAAERREEARAGLEQALDRYERKRNLVMAARVRERLAG